MLDPSLSTTDVIEPMPNKGRQYILYTHTYIPIFFSKAILEALPLAPPFFEKNQAPN
jgi:hypothetical protein